MVRWIRNLFTPAVSQPITHRRTVRKTRPRFDLLEDRWAPAVITVTTFANDAIAVDGQVTLAEAIQAANTNTAVNEAIAGDDADAGGDIIRFTAGLGTLNLSTALDFTAGPSAYAITSKINFNDTNETGLTLNRSAGSLRLFYVSAAGELILNSMTVNNFQAAGGAGGSGGVGGGGAGGLGGAIFNEGTATVVACTFTNNVAQGGAGGAPAGGITFSGGGGGGLGGIGGNGSTPGTFQSGGGGGGASGAGVNATVGGAGGAGGAPAAGGGAAGGAGVGAPLAVGGAGNSGGGGGGFGNTTGGSGGLGGFGGGGGGGGGGGASGAGGAGGFGGGGGGTGGGLATGTGGVGGFGGGGGGGSSTSLGGGTTFGGGTGGSPGSGFGGGGGGAGLGGAIFNNAGTLTIENSTFTANSAIGGASGGSGATAGQGVGGAVFSRNGTVNVTHATISSNTAAQGGRGVYFVDDGGGITINFNNNLLGQSDATITDAASTGVVAGDFASNAGNLVRNNPASGIPVAGVVSNADPLLAALASNLGPAGGVTATQTMALLPGSPAINTGNGASLATDQRAVTRPQGALADIGAFEARNYALVFNTVNHTASGQTINSPGGVTVQITEGTFAIPLAGIAVTVAIETNGGPGGVLSGTTVQNTNAAGLATFANLSIDNAGNGYTLDANATSFPEGDSNAFNITASQLDVTVPAEAQAGANFTVTVVARDAGGNIAENYTFAGTELLAFTVNAPAGGTAQPISSTPVTNVAGTATFNAALDDAADGYTITANGTSSGFAISDVSNAFDVTANQLVVVDIPSSAVVAGSTFSIQVQALDANNNPAENFTFAGGEALALALTAPIGGTAPFVVAPTLGTVNNVTATASYDGARIDNAANGYTVTASGTSGGSPVLDVGNAFNVTASRLEYSVQPPAQTRSGVAFTVTVRALDNQAGSVVAENFTGVVTVLIDNLGGATPGTPAALPTSLTGTTALAATAGIATFPGLALTRGGSFQLRANSSVTVNTGVVPLTVLSTTVDVFASLLQFGFVGSNRSVADGGTPRANLVRSANSGLGPVDANLDVLRATVNGVDTEGQPAFINATVALGISPLPAVRENIPAAIVAGNVTSVTFTNMTIANSGNYTISAMAAGGFLPGVLNTTPPSAPVYVHARQLFFSPPPPLLLFAANIRVEARDILGNVDTIFNNLNPINPGYSFGSVSLVVTDLSRGLPVPIASPLPSVGGVTNFSASSSRPVLATYQSSSPDLIGTDSSGTGGLGIPIPRGRRRPRNNSGSPLGF